MKRIITAIGNEKLNNILKVQEGIKIESSDIQYQEGIVEALDKYPLTDIIILKDDIIGELNLEELILSITILKNDIKIILITENREFETNKNIVKIIDDKNNYVECTIKYLSEEIYINKEKVTSKIENIEKQNYMNEQNISNNITIQKTSKRITTGKKLKEYLKNLLKKKKIKREVILIIGNSGVRENNIYLNSS